MKSWKKGAILGFLLIPVVFLISSLLMVVAALIQSNTFGGMVDAFFMLFIIPMSIVHKIIGNIYIFPYFPLLSSILFWTLIGAVMGYLVDKRKG